MLYSQALTQQCSRAVWNEAPRPTLRQRIGDSQKEPCHKDDHKCRCMGLFDVSVAVADQETPDVYPWPAQDKDLVKEDDSTEQNQPKAGQIGRIVHTLRHARPLFPLKWKAPTEISAGAF